MLTKIVIIPVEKLTFNEIPWARTLQGEAPANDTINNPSPKPNKVKPKHKKRNVEIFGLKSIGFLELQYTLGISFIFKNISVIMFNYIK